VDTSILALIDGSKASRRSVRFAAQMAGWASACLVVVAPIQVPPVPRPAMVSPKAVDRIRAEARDDVREAGARELESVRADPYIGVPGEYWLVEIEQDLAQEVTALLFEGHFLGLVLPRRGISGLRPWRGDRTTDIVKQSPVPVTLVP
jgi:nucleotide-binding universal stress UspA family protein